MGDFLTKLHILWLLVAEAITHWRTEVWTRDLDEHHCCPGDPMRNGCGCMGVTIREIYAPSKDKGGAR